MTRPVVGPGIVLAAVALVALLTGCHSNPSRLLTPSASSPASASAAPSATPAAASACTRDGLTITYQGTDNTAGHLHGILTFTNTGAACTLLGYPTVWVGQPEAEQPVGAVSTDDTTASPALVSLAPGASAHAAITITDAGVVCDPVSTDYLIVAPPLGHPADWDADGRHVSPVDIGACSDPSISLVQVGPVTG